jgi:hypothetical protein
MNYKKDQIKIKDTLSLMTYGNVLPGIASGEVTGIFTYSGLKKPEEALANHVNIYPSIPPIAQVKSAATDITELVFISILVGNKEYELALDWIINSSIMKLNKLSVNFRLDDVDSNSIELLKAILISEGFNPIVTSI